MQEERRKRKRKGFMILELIIVVAIIGVLAAMAVPNLTGLTDEARWHGSGRIFPPWARQRRCTM